MDHQGSVQQHQLDQRDLSSSLTNASRGTANARHSYHALVFVVTVLCGKLVVALSAP
ncbi:TPA: DUF3265 domain-containing protein [Vibrio vulnificus]|nr:DUF3265 domain-containing protein [Vibrio vulnificus]HAS8151663.1 DUF3265 domain-containing protein [Vibrio vulnificus]